MIFRLSQNLAAKIHEAPMKLLPADENPYADWSARLFTADRTQYILVANSTALYGTVFYGRGIIDDNDLLRQSFDAIREVMVHDGLEFIYWHFVALSSNGVQLSTALNRSVTGSMNEMVEEAKFCLLQREASPFDASCQLNEMPLSLLKGSSPREMLKKLFTQNG